MNSKGHISTGVTTGASVGVILTWKGTFSDSFLALIICGVFSIVTSQLPDIDSPKSKISKKFPFCKWITNPQILECLIVADIVSFFFFLLNMYPIHSPPFCLFLFFMIMTGLHFVCKLFFTHRRFTHTLLANGLFSLCLLYPYFFWNQNTLYLYASMGMISGLLSHLFYDTITVRGCPLFFPFYKKYISPVRCLHLKSGKYDKKGCVFSFCFFLFILLCRIFSVFF